jgi:hypothetical protein
MVALDAVVRVLLGVVERGWDQLIDRNPQRRGSVGDDLDRLAVGAERRREEPACRSSVAPCRHVNVDDLAMLIDRPVDVAPPASDLDVGLVDVPTVADPRGGTAGLHRRGAG